MGVVTLLVISEVLGIALLKFTGIEDAYILITMAAVIVGAFWKLRMEQQKIKIDNDNLKAEYQARMLEITAKMAELDKQMANKVDLSVCHIDHLESKKLFKSITEQITTMNVKIEANHSEVLQTIIQLLHTKDDRGL